MDNIVLIPIVIGIVVGSIVCVATRKGSFMNVDKEKVESTKFWVCVVLLFLIAVICTTFLDIKVELNFAVGELLGLIIIFIFPAKMFSDY